MNLSSALLSGLASLFAPCALVAAQSFNIDVADLAGGPSNSYAAAAGQAGHWNVLIGGPPYALALLDLNGQPSSVTTHVTAVGNGTGDYTANHPNTTGDDQALMDDLQDVGNGATNPPASTTWTFNGLREVYYDVYVYAWAPDSTTYISVVSACGSGLTEQVVGDWPGMHVEGVTYARITALAVAGQVKVCIDSGGLPANFSSVNGFQLVEGDPPPPGTPACFGDGSGTFCGCGNDVPPGTPSGCANGFGIGAQLVARGSASLSEDTLVLEVSGVPAQPGLFFQGNVLTAGGAGFNSGDGLRCCGQALIRLQVVNPPAPAPTGAMTSLTISRHPGQSLTVGDSRCYQFWYRDPGASPCGEFFNYSNGYTVTWGP